MKDEGKHIDYELISKYLSGETSPEENQQIESWKDSSRDNLNEFERLSRLWKEAESLISHSPARVDTEAAWTRLQGRLFDEGTAGDSVPGYIAPEVKATQKEAETDHHKVVKVPSKIEGKTRGLYYYVSRIAAVVIMGFLIYAIFFMQGGKPNQVEVIADNTIKVTDLPDDSRITLNENSKITYPEEFKKDERVVELTGEAFFEVKSAEKKPFVVRAQNAIVRVLGTSFNVRAIETEAEVSVTVEKGKVRLSDDEDVAYIVLEENEKGVFNRDTGHIEKYERSEGDEMFWKSRTLMFRDTELAVVFNTLEKLYKTEIIIKNDNILSCLLTGKFQDMDINDILEKIAITFNLTIQKNKNSFEISGEGC